MKQRKRALNVLIIPDLIPYPPNDGGRLCIFGMIDYLRKFHHIQILLTANHSQDKFNIQALMLKWPDVTIHYVESYTDAPKKTIWEKTITRLKKILKRLFHLIKNANKRPVSIKNIYSRYDNIYYSTPFYPHPEIFVKKLGDIIIKTKFDIIQTELSRMLNLVNFFPDEIKKVFVQIEVRSDILFDYGIANNFSPNYIKHVAGNAEFLEFAYMNKYDAILTLNETDKIKIMRNVPMARVFTSPFGILDADIKELDMEDYKAENLIFMGSEGHYPNFDGLNWFLTDIITEFKVRPFKKIFVSGSWSAETINRFRELNDCIDFIGFVDELSPYLKNSVSIVPIRIGGGGIRTKILSAMANGSPVVATSLSAVGIKGNHRTELLISDTITDFANSINSLFNNNNFALTLRKNAYQLLKNEYSQSTVGNMRNKIYNEICEIN
jgi:glycosyltransferase involved in cell wall biosynthesis